MSAYMWLLWFDCKKCWRRQPKIHFLGSRFLTTIAPIIIINRKSVYPRIDSNNARCSFYSATFVEWYLEITHDLSIDWCKCHSETLQGDLMKTDKSFAEIINSSLSDTVSHVSFQFMLISWKIFCDPYTTKVQLAAISCAGSFLSDQNRLKNEKFLHQIMPPLCLLRFLKNKL